MKYKAVITGDIVDSRKIENLQELLSVLKETIPEIGNQLKTTINFEIYRGDSFQLLINNPENAIKTAFLLRAKLRSKTPFSEHDDALIPIDKLWDARVSVAIATIDKPVNRVVESTGEAFVLSGKQIDSMKNSKDRIRFTTCWSHLNPQFEVLVKLSDAIFNRWTLSSSEAAYRYLLFNETQKQIAKLLKVSQPAVHKRLSIANIDAIRSMLDYLNQTIKKLTHGI